MLPEDIAKMNRDEIARLRRELAEARAIIDKVEEIAVNNRTGCGTCTTVVNPVVSYAADQPPACIHVWTEKVPRPVCMVCGAIQPGVSNEVQRD